MLIALVFGNPLLLIGLIAMAIPIAIHFLNRRRYVHVPWGAMRFLRQAQTKTRRRTRLEQLLLLSLRCLAAGLLAVALAQPMLSGTPQSTPAAPTHRILVVDTSLSMGAGTERSAFDQAIETANRVLGEAKTGDATSMLRLGGSRPGVIVTPSFDPNPLQNEVDRLTVDDEAADPARLTGVLAEALAAGQEFARREIVFLSDFQATNWQLDAAAADALRSVLADAGGSRRVTLVHCPAEPSANRFVADVQLSNPLVIAGRAAAITAEVRTDRAEGKGAVAVELLVDGRRVAEKTAEIGDGLAAEVRFNHEFALGEHAVEIRLPGDILPADNQRWLVVSARDAVKTLIVDGETTRPEEQRTALYLRTALRPRLRGSVSEGVIRETVRADGELIRTDLSQFDCVHLCNVRTLSERETDMLRRYVQQGGGVVIWLGSQVVPENYNAILASGETPLLPGTLVDIAGREGGDPDVFDFATDNLEHPIVRPFAGNPGTGLEVTTAFRYHKLAPAASAEPVLNFSTGDAAILEWSVGAGRVVAMTTSLEPEWSSWALWGHSLVPIVQEATLFAAGGNWNRAEHVAGSELVARVDPRQFDPPYRLLSPGGNQVSTTTTYDNGLPSLVSDPLRKAGVYRLESSAAAVRPARLFAVNPPVEESALVPLNPSALTNKIFAGLDAEFTTDWEPWVTATPSRTTNQFALGRWLLLALLCVLLIEPILAWNRSVGLAACGLLLAVAFLRILLPAAAASWIITLLLLAGGAALLWTTRRTA